MLKSQIQSRWVSWPPHDVLHFLLSMFLWLKSLGLGVLCKISHGTAAAHEKGDLKLLRSQVLMLCNQILYGRDGGCSIESSFRGLGGLGGLGEEEGQGRRKRSLTGPSMSLGVCS